MSTEQTRKTIQTYLAGIKGRDFDGLLALASANATYWLCGPPEVVKHAGSRPYTQFIDDYRKAAQSSSQESLEKTSIEQVGEIFCENGHGAVELRLKFETPDGKPFDNTSFVKFVVGTDGKIEELRQYEDGVAWAALYHQLK